MVSESTLVSTISKAVLLTPKTGCNKGLISKGSDHRDPYSAGKGCWAHHGGGLQHNHVSQHTKNGLTDRPDFRRWWEEIVIWVISEASRWLYCTSDNWQWCWTPDAWIPKQAHNISPSCISWMTKSKHVTISTGKQQEEPIGKTTPCKGGTLPKWLKCNYKLCMIVTHGFALALNLVLSRWWVPLGHEAMITPCFDTPPKFLSKNCWSKRFNLSIEQWEQRVGQWDPWLIDCKLCGKQRQTVPHSKCFLGGLHMASGDYQFQSQDFLLSWWLDFATNSVNEEQNQNILHWMVVHEVW